MIKSIKKQCKVGKGKSKDFSGCGNFDYLKNGLCRKCYPKWYFSTEQGMIRTMKAARARIDKEKKRIEREKRKEKKEKKIDLMSVDKYRSTVVQPIINEIARLIDYGQPCIATNTYGKMSGGHYHSVGSNRTISLNLHNIHMQCFHSNNWKGGDNIKYRAGLIRVYGQEYADFVEGLISTPTKHLSKADLYEIKKVASKIRNELRQHKLYYSTEMRISLRTKFNAIILGV